MAYDEFMADRVRQVLHEKNVSFKELKMMGCLGFMVDEKMCVGIDKVNSTGASRLMCRIGVALYEQSLLKDGCSEFNFTGRPMKGFVFISSEAIDMQDDLEYWIQLCLDYNPLARKSKK
jgi:hypothetical protein